MDHSESTRQPMIANNPLILVSLHKTMKYNIYITIEKTNESGIKSLAIEREYAVTSPEELEDLFINAGVSIQDTLLEQDKQANVPF